MAFARCFNPKKLMTPMFALFALFALFAICTNNCAFAAPMAQILEDNRPVEMAAVTDKIAQGNFAFARMFAYGDDNGGLRLLEKRAPGNQLQLREAKQRQPRDAKDADEGFAFAFAKRGGKFAKRSGKLPFAVELVEWVPLLRSASLARDELANFA